MGTSGAGPGTTGLSAEMPAVAVFEPQADGQIGLSSLRVFAREAIQAPLQILQQALGLLPLVAQLIAILLQATAFTVQCALDALVDGALAGAHALVLGLLVLVVVERCLQLVAQLFDLGNQRGHGVARCIALDPQGFHFFGGELIGAGL